MPADTLHAPMTALVRAASLTHYAEVARSVGLDPIRMLAAVGLSPVVLREPDLRIPASRAAELLERSAVASGVENFGLRMAESRNLSNLGPVGLVMRDQPTLRDSLSVLVRYHAKLNGSLAVMIEESAGVVTIREEVIVDAPGAVRQSIELALGVMIRLIRQVLGPAWQPRRVCFTHAAPADIRLHLRHFGACVEFEHDFNGIVCARSDLDVRNPAADPGMTRYAEQLLEAMLQSAPGSILDDVRGAVLLLLPAGRCSFEQVSSHLGLALRTVQRRLAEQGVSFSSLVNEARVQLAERHVDGSARPLTDVAALLGFSAPSGFSRWYQAQFGCSPTQGRAAAATGAGSRDQRSGVRAPAR